MHRRMTMVPLVLLIMAILIPACQADRTSEFFGQCKPPCWRGIQPGKTTWQQAQEIVRRFQDVDTASIKTIDGNLDIFNQPMRRMSFKLSTGETIGIIALNDIVAIMYINPSGGGVSLGTYINEFGTPEYAATSTMLGPGIPILPTSGEHTRFFGLTPSKGVAFDYDTLDVWHGPDFTVDKDTKIPSIEFFDPDKYDQLLENGFIVSTDRKGFSKDELYPWKGFGDIRQLYPVK